MSDGPRSDDGLPVSSSEADEDAPVGPNAVPAVDSSGEPDTDPTAAPRRRLAIPGWVEFPLLIVGAFLLAFLVKTFLVQAFYIPSGSMEQTLQVGDRVLVNKMVYRFRPIERGDIVVFDGTGSFISGTPAQPDLNPVARVARFLGEIVGIAPPSDRDFIKRVIGVGGDRVVCCDADGQITVNGFALMEQEYLYPGNPPSKQTFDVIVPDGRLWVMGDHRSASADSRAHLGDPGGGMVPVDRVIGRAFSIVWPLDRAQFLPIPESFAILDQESPPMTNGVAEPGVDFSREPEREAAWLDR